MTTAVAGSKRTNASGTAIAIRTVYEDDSPGLVLGWLSVNVKGIAQWLSDDDLSDWTELALPVVTQEAVAIADIPSKDLTAVLVDAVPVDATPVEAVPVEVAPAPVEAADTSVSAQ